ncbi:DNA-directed DNA polymerase [Tanacetum coccineum]
MELVHQTRKASKITPEDVINSMPENVITNILDRLPIQEAVRTGVLSRKWKYMWNMVTQLVFDNAFFKLGLAARKSYDYGKIISRLLLCLNGPITKFVLHIAYDIILDYEDICLWVLFLSRKGIKEFTVTNYRGTLLIKLPAHLFSCLELKHLKLHGCRFHIPQSFSGFPNLLSLDLSYIVFESGSCMDFISKGQPPLLEILGISFLVQTSKIKSVEIAKLKNLKMLHLPLCKIDNVAITRSPNMQSLTITGTNNPPPVFSSLEIYCSTMEQMQLRNVVFTSCRKRDTAYQRQVFTRKRVQPIPNTAYPPSAIRRTSFGFHPFQLSYPPRKLTMEEMLYKFIDEGRREHEEMGAFIREFKTTNKLLLKERNNSLSELEFEVYGLSKAIDKPNEVLIETRPQEAEEQTIQPQTPLIPFPHRLKKEKEEAQQRKFLENLKQLHINIPFTEALSQMPKYAKNLKGLLSNKAWLEEACTVTMNEICSMVLLNKLPSKEKDPGGFTIPCDIGHLHINNALADLGASISLMPYAMYEKLGLGNPNLRE